MPRTVVLPILLVILVGSVYLYTATSRAILDDGDALYATVALQMVESGDWVTPYANGVRFLDKPPMMYWLMGGAYLLFGHNEFAARFPSVLAVLGTALLLYRVGAKYVGRDAGLCAGLASALCVGTFLFTRMVFPDMIFVFFLTFALNAFLEWYTDETGPQRPALMFYGALACAMLTKGMIGIVFPVAILLIFLFWEGSLPRLRKFHIAKGAVLFLALSLPWHILAARRIPGFLWYFFINEQVLRFLGRRRPVDYESIPVVVFWALLLVWVFPVDAFFPAVLPLARARRSEDAGARALVMLALSWVLLVLGFFTFSSRIEHYALPLVPPLALLAGIALARGELRDPALQRQRDRWVNRGFGALAILGALIGIALAVTLILLLAGDLGVLGQGAATRHFRAYNYYFAPVFDMPPQMLAQLLPPLLGTCSALALGLLGSWWWNRRGRRLGAIGILGLMMAGFCLMAYRSLGVCEEAISSRQFGMAIANLYLKGDRVVTFGDFEAANSLNFYTPTPLEMYGGTAAVLSWGLQYPDAPHRILTRTDFDSRWNGDGRVFLLIPDNKVPTLGLPHGYEIMRSAGRTLLCNRQIR